MKALRRDPTLCVASDRAKHHGHQVDRAKGRPKVESRNSANLHVGSRNSANLDYGHQLLKGFRDRVACSARYANLGESFTP